MTTRLFLWAFVLITPSLAGAGTATAVQDLQRQWARITYETPADDRETQLRTLASVSDQALLGAPKSPELLVWHGIVYSSLAAEAGGLGALKFAKKAKASMEQAIELQPDTLQGSAYTSLGVLYHKVPGWPIGFGSDKKAYKLLNQALLINPNGIDPNYFMAEYLFDEGQYEEAKSHAQTALAAPARSNRPVADRGRRQEIELLLQKIRAQ